MCRLAVLDDWRCMLKIEVQRLGQCCDIALNRIAMGSTGANEEMRLGELLWSSSKQAAHAIECSAVPARNVRRLLLVDWFCRSILYGTSASLSVF